MSLFGENMPFEAVSSEKNSLLKTNVNSSLQHVSSGGRSYLGGSFPAHTPSVGWMPLTPGVSCQPGRVTGVARQAHTARGILSQVKQDQQEEFVPCLMASWHKLLIADLTQTSDCRFEGSEGRRTSTTKQTPRKRALCHLPQAQLHSDLSYPLPRLSSPLFLLPVSPSPLQFLWVRAEPFLSAAPRVTHTPWGVPVPAWVTHRWGFGAR